jgi:hypothetical protein
MNCAAAQTAAAPVCQPGAEQATVAPGLQYRHLNQCTATGEPWSIHVLQMNRWEPGLAARAVSGHGPDHPFEMQRELPTQMAADALTASTNVVAAVNGDYDGAVLGVSLGVSVTSGQLWTAKHGGEPAIGFLRSGEPVIGVPDVSIQMRQGRRKWQIRTLNKPLNGTEPVLYTRAFRDVIKSEETFRALVIAQLTPSPPLRTDSNVRGIVAARIDKTHEIRIPDDALVVIEPESSTISNSPWRVLHIGQTVHFRFDLRLAGRKGVRDVIGGRPVIVRNGRREIDALDDQYLEKRHPRTAACYNDSSVIFVVVDGRQPKLSVGMTLEELGDLMVSLGCRIALNLDGGGSSVMVVALPPASAAVAAKPDPVSDPPLRIVNSPSDGKERGRGNAWILVRKDRR